MDNQLIGPVNRWQMVPQFHDQISLHSSNASVRAFPETMTFLGALRAASNFGMRRLLVDPASRGGDEITHDSVNPGQSFIYAEKDRVDLAYF